VLDEVPPVFAAFLSEPAFSMANTTFCIWRTPEDLAWNCGRVNYPDGNDPDGSENLLWMLDANPLTYQEFAEEYYERAVHLEAVQKIYDHTLLTENLARQLSFDVDWDALKRDALEIGYPTG